MTSYLFNKKTAVLPIFFLVSFFYLNFYLSGCQNSTGETEVEQDVAQMFRDMFDEAIQDMRDDNYASATARLERIRRLALEKNYPDAIGDVQGNLGLIEIDKNNLELAQTLTDSAILTETALRDTMSLLIHISQKARILRIKAQFSEAAEIYESVLDIAASASDSLRMGTISNGLGSVLLELEDYPNSLRYYVLAEKSWRGGGRLSSVAIAIHNQGDALRGMGRLDEALTTYKRALKLKRELNRTNSSAYTLTGLGRTYLLMDSIDRAEEVLEEALEIRGKLTNKNSYAESLLIMSRVSAARRQYHKAEAQLKEVEQIARNNNKADLLRDAFEDQRTLYKKWGRLAELAEVDELYDIMTDSLYREEKLKVQEAQAAASLQREQQRTQLAQQTANLAQLKADSEGQKAQFRLVLVVVALLGLLVIAWQLQQIRKRNASLVALNARIKLITDNAFHSQKNALGLISALLRSKARQAEHDKELEVLKDVEGKIEALGGVAKYLFQRRIEDNTAVAARVSLKAYLEELVADTFASVASKADLDLEVADIETTSNQALNLGLIINEGVTNFSKYAEPGGAETLMIRVLKEEETLLISMVDDGPGFPEDFDFSGSNGFGMQMMANLVSDMEGSIDLKREDNLTTIEIRIPLKS